MESKEMICIVCPLGCNLTVDNKGDDEFSVTGNKCPRGEKYGIKEMTNPTRVLTTTVKVKNSHLNRLPVRTEDSIPKSQLFEVMEAINKIEIMAPIKAGEVVIENILNTGVDVIASRSM